MLPFEARRLRTSFFSIVRRDGAMIMFKALGAICDGKESIVEPLPNYGREPAFSWDAYLDVPDPAALAAEFASRGVLFSVPLTERDGDGVRGFADHREPDQEDYAD